MRRWTRLCYSCSRPHSEPYSEPHSEPETKDVSGIIRDMRRHKRAKGLKLFLEAVFASDLLLDFLLYSDGEDFQIEAFSHKSNT